MILKNSLHFTSHSTFSTRHLNKLCERFYEGVLSVQYFTWIIEMASFDWGHNSKAHLYFVWVRTNNFLYVLIKNREHFDMLLTVFFQISLFFAESSHSGAGPLFVWCIAATDCRTSTRYHLFFLLKNNARLVNPWELVFTSPRWLSQRYTLLHLSYPLCITGSGLMDPEARKEGWH